MRTLITQLKNKINRCLERILPSSNTKLRIELGKINEVLKRLEEAVNASSVKMEIQLVELETAISQSLDAQNKIRNEQMAMNQVDLKTAINQRIDEEHNIASKQIEMMHVDLKTAMNHKMDEYSKLTNEILWASIFNNTIAGSEWLKNKSFSPGRAALGYSELYVLYRILDNMHPQSILELGLGESTSLITQYAEAFEAKHTIVESEPSWCEYYSARHVLSKSSSIQQLPYEMRPFKEVENVRQFKDFSRVFSGIKFDFILIDAPFSVDMKVYARVDCYTILPQCLDPDHFVIIIDDTERIGEKNTVKAICQKLKDAGIAFSSKEYKGQKNCTLICSAKTPYYCTL